MFKWLSNRFGRKSQKNAPETPPSDENQTTTLKFMGMDVTITQAPIDGDAIPHEDDCKCIVNFPPDQWKFDQAHEQILDRIVDKLTSVDFTGQWMTETGFILPYIAAVKDRGHKNPGKPPISASRIKAALEEISAQYPTFESLKEPEAKHTKPQAKTHMENRGPITATFMGTQVSITETNTTHAEGGHICECTVLFPGQEWPDDYHHTHHITKQIAAELGDKIRFNGHPTIPNGFVISYEDHGDATIAAEHEKLPLSAENLKTALETLGRIHPFTNTELLKPFHTSVDIECDTDGNFTTHRNLKPPKAERKQR